VWVEFEAGLLISFDVPMGDSHGLSSACEDHSSHGDGR
jgi:hypothetical protein